MRTFVIGDIHGYLEQLVGLVDFVGIKPTDTLVTLGDYIDRGPHSKGVIDWLINYRGKLVPLKGNHEELMIAAKDYEAVKGIWLSNGGGTTLESYGTTTLDSIPEEHWKFMASCRDYHHGNGFFCVHAYADPAKDFKDQNWDTNRWTHLKSGNLPSWNPLTMICGHTAQKSGKVLSSDHLHCIDTGVFRTGWLTCLEPETGKIWQVGWDGEKRLATVPQT
jgi:serine/threonine protein phosphatase 1